jgi:hypothetical protein
LTTSATITATNTMTASVITFSLSAIVNVYSGGVRKKLSSSPDATAASSAGPSPPISATTTTAKTNSITSVGSPSNPRPVTEIRVANAGNASPKSQPSSLRLRESRPLAVVITPVLISPLLSRLAPEQPHRASPDPRRPGDKAH